MTDHDHARKLDELERLLNDPDVPMDPARVWSLLAELSRSETSVGLPRDGRGTVGNAPTARTVN